jgi:hypothetical protein
LHVGVEKEEPEDRWSIQRRIQRSKRRCIQANSSSSGSLFCFFSEAKNRINRSTQEARSNEDFYLLEIVIWF